MTDASIDRAPDALPLATPTRARTALSVALLTVLYLWVFPYHTLVNNPNENVRVYMTVAIVDDHTFAINRVERDWGYVNDKSVREGRLFSSKAPGSSLMGVPAYWLLTHLTHRDSHPLTPAQIVAHHAPPLDRTVIVYVLRLWSNALPALLFAWFWHRFLGRHTRSEALRESVFWSTMAGSLLFAYSEVFASHAQNALCAAGALMAIATVRERDARATAGLEPPQRSLGPMFVAGLLGAAVTMFEYPAAIATGGVALLILATGVERRAWFALLSVLLGFGAAAVYAKGHKTAALVLVGLAALDFALTLSPRSLVRFIAAGAGGAIPTALTLYYHKRCFGSPFKTGYSFLENAEFRANISQGFFGATHFSWESGVRLWLDPGFGLVPGMAIGLASLMGLGAWFAWRPPAVVKQFVWPLRVGLTVTAGVLAVRAGHALVAAKDGNWTPALGDKCAPLAWLVVTLIALASVSLPPARVPDALDGTPAPRSARDPAIGATILLVGYGLSRLIGMMNNWRGGWTVGPRYLSTLVPLVGFAALVGLEAFAEGSAVRRRVASVFAAGATVLAMLLSGLPSAFFPHIPTEFISPFFELFVPVVRAGFVPHNAGAYLFHWTGLRSMWPFFAAAAAAVAIVLRGDERRTLPALAHVLAGLAVALALLAPFAAVAQYSNVGVTRFVKSVWEPPPPPLAPPPVARGAHEPAAALRERARNLAESGDTAGAWDAWRRAAAQP